MTEQSRLIALMDRAGITNAFLDEVELHHPNSRNARANLAAAIEYGERNRQDDEGDELEFRIRPPRWE